MTARPVVLFVDQVHPFLKENLEKIGYQCVVKPGLDREDLLGLLPGLTGIIVRSRFRLGPEELSLANSLRFVGRVGSGLENIDVDYASGRGIACLNSPEGNRDSVGEHAVGMLLALLNKLCQANAEVSRGCWNREKNRGTELMGKTMGIVGYGNTGSALARCLSGFRMRLLAYDKYKTGFGNQAVSEATMEELFDQADFLSLHLPLTNETRQLVDLGYLNRFRKNIVLINTSRGQVVNTRDLVTALESGRLSGAALDVLEYEHLTFEKLELRELPPPFQYLAAHPRVMMTPHVAGWTHESYRKLSEVLFEKIRALPLTRA